MKNILFSILLLAGISSSAQNWDFEKPDYDKIEKDIGEKKSKLYYPKLMERYQDADSTMTLEEKRHLYYGYVFQPGYSPYSNSAFADSLRLVLQKEKHSKEDLNNIIRFGDSVFVDFPFDLTTMSYQLYALDKKGDKEKFYSAIIRSQVVFDALMSSGDGTSKKNAFYVINTSHEYALLNYLGFRFRGTQSLIEHYDYLTLAENKYGLSGLYFDVSPCLNFMENLLKD